MAFVVENENLQKALQLRKEDNPEALLWLEKACADGDGVAFYLKAQALFQGGFFLKQDRAGATRCLQQSAMAGCPWGMFAIGCFSKGEEKLAWFEKALALHDDYACGKCYYFGFGVEKNLNKAQECWLRAAHHGNPLAQLDAGISWDVCENEEERAAWLEKAASCGDARAMYEFAKLLQHEKNIKDEVSFSWFLRSAMQKHTNCMRETAIMLENGRGCTQNLPLSALFFLDYGKEDHIQERLAAKFNDPRTRLQELYVYGRELGNNDNLRVAVGEENCADAIRIYKESVTATRKAVVCFIWICKQTRYLNRDIQRIIGKIVFDSREDPFLWGVRLKEM